MREIKFRAWDNNDKSWAPEEDFCINGCGIVNYLDVPLNPGWDDYTIELFTGLKDKNGKEIYEGDIIDRSRWGMQPGEVYVSDAAWNIRTLDMDGVEVIGNIHENPKLLASGNGEEKA